ncbi:MAG TPA: flagellar export protein FliJ [Planctomycetaceae bacterium]|nr:flagellar export protein FliJ [Planctomycetaceae bacterium]
MREFTFPLASLLKLRRHRRELCRQLLAGVLADDGRLQAEHAGLESERHALLEELRRLGGGGPVEIDRSAARRYYAAQLNRRLEHALSRRQLVAGQLDLCRQALLKADGEVRMLERLEETRRAEHRYEEERRAARELDDVWSAQRILQRRV